jgi:cytochrome c
MASSLAPGTQENLLHFAWCFDRRVHVRARWVRTVVGIANLDGSGHSPARPPSIPYLRRTRVIPAHASFTCGAPGIFRGLRRFCIAGGAANYVPAICTGAIVAALMGICMEAQEKRDSGTPSRRKEVFEQCSGCHSAESDEWKVGPSLKVLLPRGKLGDSKVVTERNIRLRIAQGGDGMPAYSDLLSDKEKIDLISHLKTL